MVSDMKEKLKNHKKIIKQFQLQFGTREDTAQEAVDELRRMADKNGGILDSQDIVDASEPSDATLHNIFDWDGTNAERLAVIEGILDNLTYIITLEDKLVEVEEYIE